MMEYDPFVSDTFGNISNTTHSTSRCVEFFFAFPAGSLLLTTAVPVGLIVLCLSN
jgi:hypothetical protein